MLLVAVALAQDAASVPPESVAGAPEWFYGLLGGTGGTATLAGLMAYLFRARISKAAKAFMGDDEPARDPEGTYIGPAPEPLTGCSDTVEQRVKALDENVATLLERTSLLGAKHEATGAPLLHPGRVEAKLAELEAQQRLLRDHVSELQTGLRDVVRATDQIRQSNDGLGGKLEQLRQDVASLRTEVRDVIR